MANYVKFRRGSLAKYQALENYDADTLYFIYNEDESDYQLYLGSKLIAGGDIDDIFLGDLKDVIIDNVQDKQILAYINNSWQNINSEELFRELLADFTGATDSSNGTSGLVPAPKITDKDSFLKGDGTWTPIDLSIEVNENVFKYGDDKILDLKGFAEAQSGAQLTKSADGSLNWVKPDSSTVEGLSTSIATLRSDVDTLASNTYSKEETEEKIAEAIVDSHHLKRKVCENIEEAQQYIAENADAIEYIFMIPTGLVYDSDKYDEYLAIEVIEDGISSLKLEKVGSWEVDLSQYAKTEDVVSALGGKVDAEEGKRLFTDDEATKLESLLQIENVDGTLDFDTSTKTLGVKTISTSQVTDLTTWISNNAGKINGLSEINFSESLATKLAGIEINAEKNYIRSVSDQLNVSNDGQLSIKTITSSQVSDLSSLLRQKADADTVATLRTDVDALATHLTWTEL